LIEKGVAVGSKTLDQPGAQTLHVAAQHGHPEIVELLLQSGLYDVNALDCMGSIAVNVTALEDPSHPDLKTLRALLQAGPDLTIETRYAWSDFFGDSLVQPLHQAIIGRAYEAAMLLLEAGADATALAGDLYPLQCVFLDDTDLDLPDKTKLKDTDLDHAEEAELDPQSREAELKAHRLRLIEMLLERGADPNGRSGLDYVTPLMLAAHAACPESIKLLLRKGADVNAVESGRKHNALQLIVPLPGTEDDDDELPAVWGRGDGSDIKAVARLLLENGCSPVKKNYAGHCALRRFAKYDSDSGALAVVLEHIQEHCLKCLTDGCLNASLKVSLEARLFDNARLLVSAGALPSEAMVMNIIDRVVERLADYNDAVEFMKACKQFSREQGILGKELRQFLARRKRRLRSDR
jgi:ankyrin repeat protein